MNRGSPSPARRAVPTVPSFNEAPIHESGKSRRPGAAETPYECFNEAPIHESGKSKSPLDRTFLRDRLQ